MTQPTIPVFPTDAEGRFLIPASQIDTSERVRKEYRDIDQLAESIKTNGLCQPIVVNFELKLIAGGRRFKAMTELLKLTELPCVFKETMSEAHLVVLEAEENLQRSDLTWQERIMSIHKAHRYAAKEQALNLKHWTAKQTAVMLSASLASVNNALLLARYILAGDEEVLKCSGARDALNLLVKRKEDEYTAKLVASAAGEVVVTPRALARQRTRLQDSEDSDLQNGEEFSQQGDFGGLHVVESVDEDPGLENVATSENIVTIPLSKMLYRADCLEFAKSVPDAFFDHIITDIPYGIDMKNLENVKNIDDVRNEHDVESNVALYEQMLPVFYRVLKDKGFCLLWYDLDHHERLQRLAVDAGFRLQRWPLIWYKTHPCINGAANQNFTKTYECVMVLRKGNAALVKPQPDSVIVCSADREMRSYGHPFVKPFKVWEWLMKAVMIAGQSYWDPFAGVGSSVLTAVELGMKPIATEIVESHYNKMVFNVKDRYDLILKHVRFE